MTGMAGTTGGAVGMPEVGEGKNVGVSEGFNVGVGTGVGVVVIVGINVAVGV